MSTERLETRILSDAPSLLEFLAARFGYRDRARWAEALQRGAIALDGEVVVEDLPLRAGQRLGIEPADRAVDEPRVEVLWSDRHYVAIDKPPHLVCIRLSAFPQRTFVRRLEIELGSAAVNARLEPAHRIDRGTSGVVVLARDRAAFAAFQAALAGHRITKTYLAVVDGDFPHQSIVVDEPIGMHPDGVIGAQRALLRDGALDAKPAVTVFERVSGDGRHTLLRAIPRSGRTHQIRVHLAGLGFPIAGDVLYGGDREVYRDYARELALQEHTDPGRVARHLLHASRLEFEHPIEGGTIAIEAPIPRDLRKVLGESIG